MLRRLKPAELLVVRESILGKYQDGKCPLCGDPIERGPGNACLDHDHVTGLIRGVLCRNCNGIEGKIRNLVVRGRRGKPHEDYLANLVAYWVLYKKDRWGGLLHPTHLTADEKRLRTNKKARLRRARKS